MDASAILAVLLAEPGADATLECLGDSIISPVNVAEAVSKLMSRGMSQEAAQNAVVGLDCDIAQLDGLAGIEAGRVHHRARASGISLGDSFCLALGRQLHLPVLTADRAWATLDLGIEIVLIR